MLPSRLEAATCLPVGENLIWKAYYPTLIQIERQLLKIEDSRLVEQAHQLVKKILTLLNSTGTSLARFRIESSEEWKTLCSQEGQKGFDEALLWLEELMDEL